MGHHEAHCNADHDGPVGNPGCSCEAGREIKRLRAALQEIATSASVLSNFEMAGLAKTILNQQLQKTEK